MAHTVHMARPALPIEALSRIRRSCESAANGVLLGLVAFAIGKRRERAANCRHYSADAPDHQEGRTSSSILTPRTSTK